MGDLSVDSTDYVVVSEEAVASWYLAEGKLEIEIESLSPEIAAYGLSVNAEAFGMAIEVGAIGL